MSHDLRLLGLPRDASTRDIKRAYARLLKTTRPDEDATAFQRLHEAYERALHQARERERLREQAAAGDDDHAAAPPRETAEGIVIPEALRHVDDIESLMHLPALTQPALTQPPPPPPPPELAPEPPTFDVLAYLDALEARFGGGGAALRAWLEAEPALWNVSLKAGMAVPSVHGMAQRGVVASHDELEALQAFFGLDIRTLQRLQLMPAWEHLLQTSEAFGLADRRDAMAGLGGSREPGGGTRARWLDAIAWRELRGPGHAPRRWLLRLLPMAPTRIHLLRAAFHAEAGPELAERQLDPEASAYWAQAGDAHRYAPARLALGALRALALLAVALLLALAWPLWSGDTPLAPTAERIELALWSAGGIAAGWMLVGGYVAASGLAHRWLVRAGLPVTLWSVGLMATALLPVLAAGEDFQRFGLGLVIGGIALLRLATPGWGAALVLWLGCVLTLATLDGLATSAGLLPLHDTPRIGLLVTLAFLLAIALLLGRDLWQARRARRPLDRMALDDLVRGRRWLAVGVLALGIALAAAQAALAG